jgi:hypothetical protein
MNMHKHMEAIFVVTLAVIGVGSYVVDNLPEANANSSQPVARDIATPDSMAVVIVHAPKAAAKGE